MTLPFKLHDRVGYSESGKQSLIADHDDHRINDEGNITALPGILGYYEVTFTNNSKTNIQPDSIVLLEPALPF